MVDHKRSIDKDTPCPFKKVAVTLLHVAYGHKDHKFDCGSWNKEAALKRINSPGEINSTQKCSIVAGSGPPT